MSRICAIPGCPAQIGKTTLFSINSTPALTKWWQNCPWYGQRLAAATGDGSGSFNGTTASGSSASSSQPVKVQICVAHFRPHELDRSKQILRIAATAIPTLNLPQSPTDNVATGNPLQLYCRFCAKKQHQPIENHLENLVESEVLLQLCLGRGRFLEGFPSGVCDPCLRVIRIASAFIRDCEKAQDRLQKMFFGTTQQQASSFQEEEDEEEQSFIIPEAIVSLDEYEESKVNIFKHNNDDPLHGNGDDDDDDSEESDNNVNLMGHILDQCTPKKTEMSMYIPDEDSTVPRIPSNTDNPEFKCYECNRTFKRKRALTAHMESLHEGRIFTCTICGKSMGWRKTLQRHMKSHDEGYLKHKCEICDKSFSRPSHLKLHMTKHTGIKVHCPLCSAGCRCNYKLVEHITKIHHLDLETAKKYAQQAETY